MTPKECKLLVEGLTATIDVINACRVAGIPSLEILKLRGKLLKYARENVNKDTLKNSDFENKHRETIATILA